jgi:hypothetical protein
LRPGASGGQFSVELVDGTDEASRFFSLSGDQVLEESAEGYLLKIDVDGLDFEILKGFSKSLASGRIKSILIETNESELEQIEVFLNQFSFFVDKTYENMSNHSNSRRKQASKLERNVIFNLDFS